MKLRHRVLSAVLALSLTLSGAPIQALANGLGGVSPSAVTSAEVDADPAAASEGQTAPSSDQNERAVETADTSDQGAAPAPDDADTANAAASDTERSADAAAAKPAAHAASDDSLGYEFSVSWKNQAGESVADYHYDDATDPDHRSLIWTPVDNKPKTATVSVNLKVTGDANTSIPTGGLKVVVPKDIFTDWNGEHNVNFKPGQQGNRWVPQPSLSMQIPEAPNTSTSSDLNYVDNGDGTLTLSNYRPLSGGTNVSYEQSYTFYPTYVKVEADTNSVSSDLDFAFTVDSDGDGTADLKDERNLVTSITTKVDDTKINLIRDNISADPTYLSWQDAWGPKPADADDYFYISWFATVTRSPKSTQPFTYTLSDTGDLGEVVGVKQVGAPFNAPHNIVQLLPGSFDNLAKDFNGESSWTRDAANTGVNGIYENPLAYLSSSSDSGGAIDTAFNILKRYPKSLIKDALDKGTDLDKDGLPIKNTVTLTDTWRTGKEVTHTAEAEGKIYIVDQGGLHSIWKSRLTDVYRGMQTRVIEGDSTPLTYYNNGKLRQEAFYTHTETGAPTPATWNEETKTATRDPWTLTVDEDELYHSNHDYRTNRVKDSIPELDKVPDGGLTYRGVYFKVEEFDSTFDEAMGSWNVSRKPSTDYERYKPIDVYIRMAGSEGFSLYGSVSVESDGSLTFTPAAGGDPITSISETNPVTLPKDVVGLRYEHESDFAKNAFHAWTLIDVNMTPELRAMVEEDARLNKQTMFTGTATSTVEVDGKQIGESSDTGSQPFMNSTLYLSPFTVTDHIVKGTSKPTDDVIGARQGMDVTVHFEPGNSQFYSGGAFDELNLRKTAPTSGVYYDLLPAGVSVDNVRIGVYSRHSGNYRPEFAPKKLEFKENWEGSGQTMMIATVEVPDSLVSYAWPRSYYSVELRYHVTNTYENIVDRGYNVLNSALFVPTSEDTIINKPGKSYFTINGLTQKDLFASIAEQYDPDRSFFVQTTMNFNPVTVKQSGVSKKVKADADTSYAEQTMVRRGEGYSYRLNYTALDTTRTDDIVIYDILDNGSATEGSEWRGTLDYVDTSALKGKYSHGDGAELKPRVLYATTVPTELNVDDATVWTETKPADAGSIKAIAVDLRNTVKDGESFVLDRGSTLNVFVHMNAPTDKQFVNKTAVNMVTYSMRQFAGTDAAESDKTDTVFATVRTKLVDADLSIEKASTPETGTAEAPAEVGYTAGATIDYALTVKNNEASYQPSSFTVTDALPAGLRLVVPEGKTAADVVTLTATDQGWDKKPVLEIDGATAAYQDGKVTVTVPGLAPGASVTIGVPAELAAEVVKTTDFVNGAKITAIDGAETDIASNKTYHRASRSYTLTYEVAGDPAYGLPGDSATPGAVTGIEHGTDQGLAAPLTTSATTAVKDGAEVGGVWAFSGWFEAADGTQTITSKTITGDATVYGRWSFVPNRDIRVDKVWADAENQDGKRPDSVTVQLKADGQDVAGKTLTLDAGNGWAGSFADLPTRKDGKEISYTVAEAGVPAGYEAEVTGSMADGFTITNTHEIAKRAITVKKSWNDAENQDGLRLDSVTVRLFADGADTGETVTLNAKNSWTATFDDLNVNKAGAAIAYTVVEDAVEGYTSNATAGAPLAVPAGGDATVTVENKHVPEVRSITVSKAWDDAGNQDGKRPASVTVQLLANGERTGDPVVLDASNSWQHAFANLPVNKAGKAIAYTIAESDVAGYTSNASLAKPLAVPAATDGNVDVTVTNAHTPETVTIPVTKTWVDNENATGARPATVTVQLKADGEDVAGKMLTLSADGSWKGSFENLPKYKAGAEGQEVSYTVAEVAVPGYGTVISGTAADGFTVTNTIEGKVSVAVTKVWAGIDADAAPAVTVNLMADGAKVDSATLDGKTDWRHTFADLDQFKGGKEIAYTVEEDGVENGALTAGGHEYTVGVARAADGSNAWTVTNTLVNPKTAVPVTKTWDDAENQDGIRPAAVTVRLYGDGQPVAAADGSAMTAQLTAETGWKAIFDGLPTYNAKGKAIAYTVTEDAVAGYETAIAGTAADGYTVTNTHAPATTSVSVSKIWSDAENQDGIRPDQVTVRLLADGEDTGKSMELTPDADGAWTGSFENLPVNKAGKAIAYTVAEDAVAGYETAIAGTAADGYTVTNTHAPAEREVRVAKVWDDKDDLNGLRADSVTVRLLADGEDTGKSVELSDENAWSAVFTGLPVNKAGKAIAYTVAEDQVAGYEEPVVTGDADSGFTITNKRVPELTLAYEVAGDPAYGYPADSVTPDKVTGIPYGSDRDLVDPLTTAETTATPLFERAGSVTGTWYFHGWFAEPDGTEAITVKEDIITDVTVYGRWEFVPARTVSVTKVWDDADDKDGIRPEKVTVRLLANGEETGETLELTAEDGWTGAFADLTRRGEDGKDVVYTVAEDEVAGYETAIAGDAEAGFTVTNTHEPEPDEPKPDGPKPADPATPKKPKAKPARKKTLPKTGDPALAVMGSTAAAGLMALAAALRRRRRK